MSTANDVLADKEVRVFDVAPTTTVLEATQKMNDHRVGCLVVMDGGHVVGIFTERDVLRRIVAARRDPAGTNIADVMTTDVICCSRDADLEEIKTIMKDRRVRHLPIADEEGRMVGMISIGDVNAYLARDGEITIRHMQDYIHGRA